ncbi:solute carrier family 23 member 1-like isoform X2 [Octopus vulgaris]|uniref:Solute carrier family 23 member 1-like isoform X2 n=3 Tax=Octopus TaxID=6643 RepID=A0AA36AJE4_OCTVU|nr:solute carrier family 23 member 1-like isoform X2 [Octopus vulgaris]
MDANEVNVLACQALVKDSEPSFEMNNQISEKIDCPWNHLLSNNIMSNDISEQKELPVVRNKTNSIQTKTLNRIRRKSLQYNIEDNPPLHLTFLFGIQQALLSLSGSLTVSLTVANLVCAQADEDFKAKLLCTTMLMSGCCSLLQTVIGIRLPLYQGPSIEYMIPLLALSTLPEWKCPDYKSMLNATNQSDIERDYDSTLLKVQLLEGSLMLAGIVHFLIGATGVVGVMMKFIGPVTIIPAMCLVGMVLFKVATKFSESHWGIALSTAVFAGILCLYCDKLNCYIPSWNKQKHCHLMNYPLHKVFAILFAIIFGWILSDILTKAGVLSSNPQNSQYFARTDSRFHVVHSSSWFYFPYPGQFGPPSFLASAFVGFIIATMTSIIDSIGDYYACARMCGLPPPPSHAVNRGIMIEGFASCLAGAFGAGHGTSTYGGNIGAIGITKVGSRRVFQMVGVIFILFGVLGKLGAIFVIIPYPVLGGVQIISFGIFIGLVLSNMMYIDMNSSRNLAIIGISLLFGLMVPYYVSSSKKPFDTGYVELNNILQTLLGNANFVGGALACFLDNTVPGTLEERGFIAWQEITVDESNEEKADSYGLPFINTTNTKSKIFQYIPFLPGYVSPTLSCRSRCCKHKKNVDINIA